MDEARRTRISQPINICCGLFPYKSAAAAAIQPCSQLCSWLRRLLFFWHRTDANREREAQEVCP